MYTLQIWHNKYSICVQFKTNVSTTNIRSEIYYVTYYVMCHVIYENRSGAYI